MKILHLDIETAPTKGYVWSLWNQNVPPKMIETEGYVLCWAAKWDREPESFFERVHHRKKDGGVNQNSKRRMLKAVHELINEADVVVTYNGMKFDIPTLNAEFCEIGLSPPSHAANIDLYRAVKRRFRLPSYRLDFVANRLNLGGKAPHDGFTLWTGCMADDPVAWETMENYNRQDIELQESVYHKIRPWITNHPNYALYSDDGMPRCPNCGEDKLLSNGLRRTHAQTYRRYQCQSCGAWSRGNVKQSPPVKRRPA